MKLIKYLFFVNVCTEYLKYTDGKRLPVPLLYSVTICPAKEAWLQASQSDVLVTVLKYLLNEWMDAFPICGAGSQLSIIMELEQERNIPE